MEEMGWRRGWRGDGEMRIEQSGVKGSGCAQLLRPLPGPYFPSPTLGYTDPSLPVSV